jgi:TPR repeat protein
MPVTGLLANLAHRRRGMLAVVIAACAAGVEASQQAPGLEQGVALWQAGDHAAAVRLWQPLAEKGHPEAQLFMGFAHKTGRGAAADAREAAHWYQRAAERGLPEAQWELGFRYELGIGVARDAAEAARWYGQATNGDFCPSELPAGGRLGND